MLSSLLSRAEFISTMEACKEIHWLKRLLNEIGFKKAETLFIVIVRASST